jgi:hypothetical protein
MTEPGAHGDSNTMDTSGALPRGALGAWWWQGTRSVLLMRPDWSGLRATPAIVACLFLVPSLAGIGVERLYIDGPAKFYWPGLASGWMGAVLLLWTCWMLLRGRSDDTARMPPDALSLFAMLSAQALPLLLLSALVFVPMSRAGLFYADGAALWIARGTWVGLLGWFFVAYGVLLWRASPPRIGPRAAAQAVLLATMLVNHWLAPPQHWYPAPPPSDAARAERDQPLRLTQEKIEQQAPVLHEALQALAPQRRGVVDVYALTFAPYAEEDVFRRESEMVAEVMQSRFDAGGRTIQMVNHKDTVASRPWATPLNLQRAIRRVAELMDRDEDVLFIHLTSHGGRDGRLSASFWPLDVDAVTPQQLKAWLDEAGIRHRIVSVSACYSGSWIGPLSGPGTLVMTAADADHTSYGCGRHSPLTYFGRAMYDESLRNTWSFEQAHAQARTVVEQREKEAGKRDGYSNPQIAVGEGIREHLRLLETQRAAAAH